MKETNESLYISDEAGGIRDNRGDRSDTERLDFLERVGAGLWIVKREWK